MQEDNDNTPLTRPKLGLLKIILICNFPTVSLTHLAVILLSVPGFWIPFQSRVWIYYIIVYIIKIYVLRYIKLRNGF